MRRHTIADLARPGEGLEHVAARLLAGRRLSAGGLSFHSPGMRTHADETRHTHAHAELFCILQGRGRIEVDCGGEPVAAGDVLLIEPGEDHHLVGGPAHPIVNLWLHASDAGHPAQAGRTVEPG